MAGRRAAGPGRQTARDGRSGAQALTLVAIPLREALRLDSGRRHPLALADCLGDAFFLRQSPVYRRVREHVVATGFRLSSSPPFDYMALRLFALEDIWRSRCIPYHDNVSILRRVARRHGSWFSSSDATSLGLRPNHVLHESVHMLARHELERLPSPRKETPARTRIVDALFEESCANAAEHIVGSSVVSPADRFAAQMLTYGLGSKREIVAVLGETTAFRILVVAYMHANFLVQSMSDGAIDQALAVIVGRQQLRGAPRSKVRSLFRSAFGLNKAFRLKTTAIALRMMGFEGTIFEVLDFDFTGSFSPGARHDAALDRMTTLLFTDDRAARGRR